MGYCKDCEFILGVECDKNISSNYDVCKICVMSFIVQNINDLRQSIDDLNDTIYYTNNKPSERTEE